MLMGCLEFAQAALALCCCTMSSSAPVKAGLFKKAQIALWHARSAPPPHIAGNACLMLPRMWLSSLCPLLLQTSGYSRSWKQLYFQRNMEDALEQ